LTNPYGNKNKTAQPTTLKPAKQQPPRFHDEPLGHYERELLAASTALANALEVENDACQRLLARGLRAVADARAFSEDLLPLVRAAAERGEFEAHSGALDQLADAWLDYRSQPPKKDNAPDTNAAEPPTFPGPDEGRAP